jgi:hypothetical protein
LIFKNRPMCSPAYFFVKTNTCKTFTVEKSCQKITEKKKSPYWRKIAQSGHPATQSRFLPKMHYHFDGKINTVSRGNRST